MVDGIEAAELSGLVTELTVNYRSTKEIDEVATVIRSGVSNDVVAAIAQHAPAVEWVKTAQEAVDDSVAWARALRDTARAVTVESESRGAALDVLQRRAILCATHEGPNSVAWWRDIISRRLGAERAEANRFAVGTPILVTVNEQSDIANSERLSNGDLGVAVPSEDGAAVLFGPTSAPRLRRESEITSADEAWAMTIHKSQGSEYDTVVVSLPPASAQGLSRELLYTAVTRAKSKLVIVGSDAALRKAVEKKTSRCSGLVDRLRANATRGA
jgi:exodeoxyribonuclease V alpha subunit